MATYNWGFDHSFVAEVDMDAYQYRFVRSSSVTSGQIAPATTAGGSVLGVLQNDCKAGDAAVVRMMGSTKLIVDAATTASPITAGGLIKCGSSGMGLGTNTGFATSAFIVAVALEAMASGSGVGIEAMILPFYKNF